MSLLQEYIGKRYKKEIKKVRIPIFFYKEKSEILEVSIGVYLLPNINENKAK